MQLYLLALLTIILLIVIAILYFMYRKVNHLSILVNQLLNDMVSLQNITESQLRQSMIFPPNMFTNNIPMSGAGMGAGSHICLDGVNVDQDNQEGQEDLDSDEDSDSDSSSDSDSDSHSDSISVRSWEKPTNVENIILTPHAVDTANAVNAVADSDLSEKILKEVDVIMENEIKKKNVVEVANVTETTPAPAFILAQAQAQAQSPVVDKEEKIITVESRGNNDEDREENKEENKKKKVGRKRKEFHVDMGDHAASETIIAPETIAEETITAATTAAAVEAVAMFEIEENPKKPVEKKKYTKKNKIENISM
jgi:hypothetical protein